MIERAVFVRVGEQVEQRILECAAIGQDRAAELRARSSSIVALLAQRRGAKVFDAGRDHDLRHVVGLQLVDALARFHAAPVEQAFDARAQAFGLALQHVEAGVDACAGSCS